MDDGRSLPTPSTITQRSWAPRLPLIILGWVIALLATGWLLFTQDPRDRLFAGVTVLVLLTLSVAATLARPRLLAGPDGIAVRGIRGTRRWPWPSVHRVAVVRGRRLGRDVPVLEIDVRPVTEPTADDELLVFSRIDLGAEPDDVADVLTALRPRPTA